MSQKRSESLQARSRASAESRSRRFQLERLEERINMNGQFTVTSVADSGAGTLRQAIMQSASDGTADTITFSPLLANKTITLTSPDFNTAFGPTGLVIAADDVTIDGAAAPMLKISGNGAERIFAVGATSTLVLKNITLTDGLARGGNGGNTDGDGGAGGGGAGLGGAVYVYGGTLELIGATLNGNSAHGGNGGNGGFIGTGGASGGGSAAANGGDFDESETNSVYGGGGGGVGGAGQAKVDGGSGGANEGGAMVSAGNNGTAGGGGGGGIQFGSGGSGLALSSGGLGGGGGGGRGQDFPGQTTVPGGGAGGFGAGGGGGASGPGGIGGFGGGGGGALNGQTASPGGFGAGSGGFSQGGGGGGGAALGGAIFNHGGIIGIVNSTFNQNTAVGGTAGTNGGGTALATAGSGLGGAIFSLDGTLSILSSTIANNTADQGLGIYNLADAGNITTRDNDTIISDGDGISVDLFAGAIDSGVMTANGSSNLIPRSIGFSGTLASTADPLLGPLADNGGPTETMLPDLESPAIDAGDDGPPALLDFDQRGFSRFVNTIVDIGSVEVGKPGPVGSFTSAIDVTAAGSAGKTTQVVVTYASPGSVAVDPTSFGVGNITVNNGIDVTGFSAQGNVVTYTLTTTAASWASAAQGTYTVSLVAGSVKDLDGNADLGVPSLGTFDVDLSKLTDTTTTLDLPAGISILNETVTFTATVTGAEGPALPGQIVILYDGETPIQTQGVGSDGKAIFTIPMTSVGPQTFKAVYLGGPVFNGSTSDPASLNVAPHGMATHFSLSGPTTAIVGTPIVLVVSALDDFGNVDAGYEGTLHFTSTDAIASIPLDQTLTNGIASIPFTPATTGLQTISAKDIVDASIAGTTAPITVNAFLSGTVYLDLNGDGLQDGDETGLVGRNVYLDLNQNGKFDTGEPTAITNAQGLFSFPGYNQGSEPVLENTALDAIYRLVVTQTNVAPDGTNLGIVPISSIAPVAVVPNPFSSDVDPNPTKAYVESLYKSALGRTADEQGLAYWEGKITGGMPLQQVSTGFLNSPEHRRTEVESYYEQFLGRKGNSDELSYYVDRLQGGDTEFGVVESFLNSPEYQKDHASASDFIGAVYDEVLSRLVDSDGLAYWEGKLTAGMSRSDVAKALVKSDEALQTLVGSDYIAYLNRQADSTSTFTSQLAASDGSPTVVASEILASSEYYKTVQKGGRQSG